MMTLSVKKKKKGGGCTGEATAEALACVPVEELGDEVDGLAVNPVGEAELLVHDPLHRLVHILECGVAWRGMLAARSISDPTFRKFHKKYRRRWGSGVVLRWGTLERKGFRPVTISLTSTPRLHQSTDSP